MFACICGQALSCSRVQCQCGYRHMQMRTPAPEKGTPRGHRGQEGNKTRSALRILNVLRYALVIAFAIDEIVLGVVLFVQRFLCLHVCESAEAHALSGKASLIHASTFFRTTASIALPEPLHCTRCDFAAQARPRLSHLKRRRLFQVVVGAKVRVCSPTQWVEDQQDTRSAQARTSGCACAHAHTSQIKDNSTEKTNIAWASDARLLPPATL